MRRAGASRSLLRGLVPTGLLAFGCNSILGNDERSFVESIGGGASGAGGTASTTGPGGASGTTFGGNGGTAPVGGAAGSPGDAGAGGVADGGEAGTPGAAGADTQSGGAATSTNAAGGSGGTSEPCECTPASTKSKQQACGNCGSATVTKVCGKDCRWGEFGEPGECTDQGVCAPNEQGEEILHCERGRWRYKRSTCTSECQWGPWTETACEGADVCDGCACIDWCTDPDTGGTTCKWIDCSEAEARAECETDLTALSCTHKEPFTFLEWLPE